MKKEKKEKPVGLDYIEKDIEKRKMSEEAYQFFIHPPGKKYPTNIRRETVDRYKVFERTWGYYANRVIIPYFMKGSIVGFSAIDMLGKKEWEKRHEEEKYKKVLYPTHFVSTECLFGFDDCQKKSEFLIVTEGAREVMKLTQEGFPNAVAILGAYMSDSHHGLITTLAPEKIYLMFDGDDAGVDITTRVAKKLSRSYHSDRIKKCFVPRGHDPKTMDRDDILKMIEKS